MKSLIALLALALSFVLFSCGGGTVNPETAQDPADVTTPGDGLAADPSAEPLTPVIGQNLKSPTPGPAAPAGVEYDSLQSLAGGTLELPPLPEGLPDPSDSALPQVLLVSVADGKTVHGSVHITATGIDDTGVNYSALLIDDALITSNESETLEHVWRTYGTADGEHKLDFIVRDDGNNVGVCSISVNLDNARDWGAPDVYLESMRCTANGCTFESEQNPSGGHRQWNIAGDVVITIQGHDGSGIRRLAAYKRTHEYSNVSDECRYDPIHSGELRLLKELAGTELTIECAASDWKENEYLLVVAEDHAGEISDFCIRLDERTSVDVFARFENALGQYLVGVRLYRMPGDWDPASVFDPLDALDMSQSNERYRCHFEDLPIGFTHFVAVFRDQLLVIPYLAVPQRNWNQIPERDYIYVLKDDRAP